jgi:predicted phage terminase large subunit-like protein
MQRYIPRHKRVDPAAAKILVGFADALKNDWASKARPGQLPPPGDWKYWLQLAGRGYGKTRSGSEWVRSIAESGDYRNIGLIGPTASEIRDVMIEGPSGILAISPSWSRPEYEPSKRRITWPNGAQGIIRSADEPESLRGPNFDAAWCDELAKWRYLQTAWDNLMLALRIGRGTKCVITTTPRPVKVLRDLVKREGDGVIITRGSTHENAANLDPEFIAEITARYAGTRIGRQELDAEILNDVPGALWGRDQLDRLRVDEVPELSRIVVAVDPAATSGEHSDETGIVVVGIDNKGRAFVLEDRSGRFQPHEWARIAISAYRKYQADRIVAETNHGGEMVEHTIRSVDPSVSFKAVTASRGKHTRAEPCSALYEQGRVFHVGAFLELEDQMCSFAIGAAQDHDDRVDALVWCLTELMLGEGNVQGYIDWYAKQAAISRGEITPEKVIIQPRERRVPNRLTPQPPATVTLKTQPHSAFYVGTRRYTADENGIVLVATEHRHQLLRNGCEEMDQKG